MGDRDREGRERSARTARADFDNDVGVRPDLRRRGASRERAGAGIEARPTRFARDRECLCFACRGACRRTEAIGLTHRDRCGGRALDSRRSHRTLCSRSRSRGRRRLASPRARADQ